MNYFHLAQTNSTNDGLAALLSQSDLPEGFCLWTDYQTAGRGQKGNVWCSAPKENLLSSFLLRPVHVPVQEQFLISQVVSVGIVRALARYTPEDIRVKWPNDIYWQDRKLAGILIENALQGGGIRHSIVGMGLNVNQAVFDGDFPAVSLCHITGQHHHRETVLCDVLDTILEVYRTWDAARVRGEYMRLLYRNTGFHRYADQTGTFSARILAVEADGRLLLQDSDGRERGYYMKEVRQVIGS